LSFHSFFHSLSFILYIIWCIVLYLNFIKVIIISVFYINSIFSLAQSLTTQKTKLKYHQWDKQDYMQLMQDFLKIVCDLNSYYWWNVENCMWFKFLIDSETLRINDRDSYRLRFLSKKSMITLKNNSHVYSLFFEEFWLS